VQQVILSAVLMWMVFAVALDLTVEDFRRVAAMPRLVIIGLLPQFFWLPIATWLITLVVDLPASWEAAMLLVACCPGGSMSNVITHLGRGNTALSVSLSAVSGVLAIVLTPLNFAWTMASNPATAMWLRELALAPFDLLLSLVLLLAVPMIAGMSVARRYVSWASRWRHPLKRLSVSALGVFIVLGLYRDRELLTVAILLPLLIVVGHNALGLSLGALTARAFRLTAADGRAVIVEAGMQNAGLALGIIALQFEGELGMVILASLWGIWHLISGLALASLWRRQVTREETR
jgi:BASS family bile acid:Na+ symporter